MEHHSSEHTIIKDFQDGSKNKPHPLEKSDDSELYDKTKLIHHVNDTVCNVELVSTQKRKVRNVLTRMKDESLRGPFRVLQRCMMENIKVKVLTRNYKHIRGICTGYILAFDKHWNLALKDVDEVYKNPIPEPRTRMKRKCRFIQKAVGSPKDAGHLNQLKPNEELQNIITEHTAGSSAASSESDDSKDIDSVSSSLKTLGHQSRHVEQELQKLSCARSSSSENEQLAANTSSALFAKGFRDSDSAKEGTLRKQTSKELRGSSAKKSEPYTPKERRNSRELNNDLSRSSKHSRDRNDICKAKKRSEIVDCIHNVNTNLGRRETDLDLTRRRHLNNKYQSNLPQHFLSSTENAKKSFLDRSIQHCNSKTEHQTWLTRHVNQLFIRGDNVVLVSLLHS